MQSPKTPETVKAPVYPPPVFSKRPIQVSATVPTASRRKDDQVDDDPFVEPGGPSKTSWATEEDIERNRRAMYAQTVMRVFHQDGRLQLPRTTRQASSSWHPTRHAPTDESFTGPPVPAHRDRLIGKSVSSPAVLEPPVANSSRRVAIPAPVRPEIHETDTRFMDRLRRMDKNTLLSASWKEVEKMLDQIEAELKEEETRSGA